MNHWRLTPSLVISILALAVALGGVAYAAVKLPPNSVGTIQLKRNAVSPAKLKPGAVVTRKLGNGAVNSAKIKDRTIRATDLAAGVLPGQTWTAAREVVPLFDVTGEFQTVVETPTLPAGSYVVWGRANVLSGAASSTLICSMANDAAQNFTVAPNGLVPLSLNGVAVLEAPGTIQLSCNKSAGTPQIAQAHVIVTRVPRIIGAEESG